MFVDSDDTVQEDYIEVLLNGIKNNDAEISIGMWQMINTDTDAPCFYEQAEYTLYHRDELIDSFLYRKIKPAPVCVLYKKEFLLKNKLFYNETVKFSEDQEFFWRVFSVINKASYTNRIVYKR